LSQIGVAPLHCVPSKHWTQAPDVVSHVGRIGNIEQSLEAVHGLHAPFALQMGAEKVHPWLASHCVHTPPLHTGDIGS
jgi:hypothetical protein